MWCSGHIFVPIPHPGLSNYGLESNFDLEFGLLEASSVKFQKVSTQAWEEWGKQLIVDQLLLEEGQKQINS